MDENLREHEINKLDNFIQGTYLEDDVLDWLLQYYDKYENLRVEGASEIGVNKTIKDSKDIILNNLQCPMRIRYQHYLHKSLLHYIKKYPYSNYYAAFGYAEHPQIQHYAPGGGFHSWHTERTGPDLPVVSRHLVYMTYLNDVNDAGETEFLHQNIKVKPEKGLTLIWPSDWTFTHRGIPSPTEDKYIITGWLSYMQVE